MRIILAQVFKVKSVKILFWPSLSTIYFYLLIIKFLSSQYEFSQCEYSFGHSHYPMMCMQSGKIQIKFI